MFKMLKKIKTWKKVVYMLCFFVSIAVGFVAAKTMATLHAVTGSVAHSDTDLSDVDLSGIKVKTDKKVVNVLIVGNDFRSEFYGADGHGLPDSMLIGTLDTKHNTLKLTSLMRDQLVDIPGHDSKNKLNSVYGYDDGGVKLLYKTIAQNYGIKVDGYVEFDFDAVREVVDGVGGVQVELTESEANYLNTTNYIQKKKFRNVKVGMQTLNGYQATGYSRIRKTVYTPTGLTDDYGRTWRQRNVINAVFTKAKKMSLSSLTGLAQTVLKKYVTTDLKSDEIITYMKDVLLMGTTKIYQMQIPVEGTYTEEMNYPGVGAVLLPDLTQNSEALNEFIFDYDGSGDGYTYQPATTPSTSTDTETDSTGY